MRKWTYKIVNTGDTGVPLKGKGTYDQRLRNGLNQLGALGWQLCSVIGTIMIFKKELKQE